MTLEIRVESTTTESRPRWMVSLALIVFGSRPRKLQAPGSKFQESSKLQIPNIAGRFWSLGFGASLEFGAWNLELSFRQLKIVNVLVELRPLLIPQKFVQLRARLHPVEQRRL